MDRLISCEFNMDNACVELKFLDGSMIAIDTIAVEKEVEGVFYPTDKVPYSTRNVVEEISRQLGVHTINLPSPSIFLKLIEKVRPDLYQKLWGDVVIDRQLALSAIGYEPRYTLEDGIREMVESFKQQK